MTDDSPYAPEPTTNSLIGSDPADPQAGSAATPRPSTGTSRWVPPTAEELARLLPQYRIECMLGHGGMGAVYKGLQPELDRPVAIKLLPAELSADEHFVSRFKREARTLANLHHPGIVAVYAFGQTSERHLYFVMEYVAGTDLRRVLQDPGLNPDQAFELIGQICEALQAAHEQGVIHRDIKPANILIAGDGRVKLADFGLSRPQQEDDLAGLTMTNMIMGTPDYMSPEQRSGYSDHRTDIYALGIMLYEMLTGKCPRGAFVPVSRKIQVDVRIDEVVLKALQEEPDLRYQQASELKRDVERIRTSKLEPVAPVPVVTPPPRRRGLALALLILILLIGIGGYFFWGKWNPPAAGNPDNEEWYPPQGNPPAATDPQSVIRVPLTVKSFKKGSPYECLMYTNDPAWSRADALPEKPAQIKSAPNLQNPTYFRIPLGNRECLAILDVGKDAKKAVLYIDFDGQGLFEAIKGIEGVDEFKGQTPPATYAKFNFGPVTLPKTEEAVAGPVEVMVSFFMNKKDAKNDSHLLIAPQKFVAGKLRIGSEEYVVAFVDGSFAGRYQTFNPSIPWSATARVQHFGATRMGIDLDKNGKFDWSEIFSLVELVHFNEKYYRVSIAPDGSEVTFQEAKPEVSVLDTKCPGIKMSVISDKCAAWLTANPDGKWELPLGKYTIQDFGLSRMVGDKKWTLYPHSFLPYFEIKAGTPTVLALGPPLALSYSVVDTSGGAVTIGLKVTGRSGETYWPVATKGEHWEPFPQFTITSETGEKLAQGTFEHGPGTPPGYAGSHSWQVPPDFTGGFRIQTKANLGPFEYKQSDQLLLK